MAEILNFLKILKERFEPFIWLVTLIAAVISGLLGTWKLYIEPVIANYVQNATVKIVSELEQIKHKIVDEFDSTYYFTKKYTFGNTRLNQEPLSQFFYAGNADTVWLFIWSEGEPSREVIKINGGKDLTLVDIGESSWTNVNITQFVKASSPLTIENYQGITKNIYEIVVTPVPLKDFSKRQESISKNEEIPRATLRSKYVEAQVSNVEREVRVYCLLIVRRSPFK